MKIIKTAVTRYRIRFELPKGTSEQDLEIFMDKLEYWNDNLNGADWDFCFSQEGDDFPIIEIDVTLSKEQIESLEKFLLA